MITIDDNAGSGSLSRFWECSNHGRGGRNQSNKHRWFRNFGSFYFNWFWLMNFSLNLFFVATVLCDVWIERMKPRKKINDFLTYQMLVWLVVVGSERCDRMNNWDIHPLHWNEFRSTASPWNENLVNKMNFYSIRIVYPSKWVTKHIFFPILILF